MADTATYKPDIFDVADERAAKGIILTPEGTSTDERWRVETPFLVDLIAEATNINERSVLVDYGCGIGRLAKPLIERFGCTVIGVDISKSMRRLGVEYVDDDRFTPMSRVAFARLYRSLSVDLVIASWILQHCPQVYQDLDFIKGCLHQQGGLFVVNNKSGMAIPTDKGWLHDGYDLWGRLEADYTAEKDHEFPADWPDLLVRRNGRIAYLRPRLHA